MVLTAKQKASITKNLLCIQDGKFDETHIKELLIDIREFMPSNSLTRELAHFVAHYERDSGKYYNLLALRMATLKILLSTAKDDAEKIDIAIDFNKIPVKVWNVVFVAGVEQHNKRQPNTQLDFMKPGNVSAFLKKAYKKVGGFYELQNPAFYATAGYTAMECLRYFDGMPLLPFDEFVSTINDEIKGFCVRHLSSLTFGNTIRRQGGDVTLCIMSILQNVTFILFNGDKAGFKLSLQGREYVIARNEELLNDEAGLMIGGGLFTDDKVNATFPYITSPFNPRQVITGVSDQQLFTDIPLVHTYRDGDGVLKLKPY